MAIYLQNRMMARIVLGAIRQVKWVVKIQINLIIRNKEKLLPPRIQTKGKEQPVKTWKKEGKV